MVNPKTKTFERTQTTWPPQKRAIDLTTISLVCYHVQAKPKESLLYYANNRSRSKLRDRDWSTFWMDCRENTAHFRKPWPWLSPSMHHKPVQSNYLGSDCDFGWDNLEMLCVYWRRSHGLKRSSRLHLVRFCFVHNIYARNTWFLWWYYLKKIVLLYSLWKCCFGVSGKSMARNEPGFHISSYALSDLDEYPVCGSIKYLQTLWWQVGNLSLVRVFLAVMLIKRIEMLRIHRHIV